MIILHLITGLNDGGAEGALFRLCKYDNKNCHVVVSLLDGGKYESKFKSNNIDVYTLKLNTILGFLTCIYSYRKILTKTNPDIIQTWLYHADLFGGICSYLLGYNKIFWNIRNCNTSTKALKSTTRIIVYLNSIISYLIPKRIISVSQNATLHHINIGFRKDKFVNIPNGYDFNQIDSVSDELLALKAKYNFLIGMVARFDPQKDHFNLLKSLAILKEKNVDFHCLLVGTGMDQSNLFLVKEINKLNLTNYITLLGRRDDINSVMQILDIHVLSSLGEAFPNVLVEAMFNGTPCISTDVGDSNFIIDKFGWVVKPESPSRLATAILDSNNLFLNNKKDWDQMCFDGKNSVISRFSIEKMVSNYNQIWND